MARIHSNRLRWKVCCISSPAEARAAAGAGADVLGLVAEMPSGPGVLPDRDIAEIAKAAPEGVETWLLTSRTDAEAIAEHVHEVGTTGVQIVRGLEPGAHAKLRTLLPRGTRIVQVVHVEGPEAVTEALSIASQVDALLLDSGRPSDGVLGGTGEVHDWSISRRLIREVGASHPMVPVWIAGGLNAQNIAAVAAQVVPHGLDLCSSLRTAGVLDGEKLAEFRSSLGAIDLKGSPEV